jgi:predicted phage-related endonuclease
MVGSRQMTSSPPNVITYPIADREAWLARRQNYLNASDTACQFGLHKYKTLAQLVAWMRGLTDLDLDPENKLLRRGTALEDDAIDELRRLQPTWQITKCEHQYVDETLRMAATPDYFAVDPEREGVGAIQVKVVARSVFKSDWPDETPPLGYLLQLSQEMMLADCTWGAIVALVIGEFSFDAYIYPVERNVGAEVRLRTAAAEFWKVFDAGENPAIDYERDGALIALLFPHEKPGKVVDLTGDNALPDLLQRREILRDTAKDVEKRLKTCETEIKGKLGDAEAAIVSGWKVTHKTVNRSGYTVEPTSYRQLRASRVERSAALDR